MNGRGYPLGASANVDIADAWKHQVTLTFTSQYDTKVS
jgi:hypothetical protein